MISIIKITQEDYKPASSKKYKRRIYNLAMDFDVQENAIRDTFTIYVAHYILYRIKKAVLEQKLSNKSMKSQYKPLSAKYRKSKPWGTRGKFWVKNYGLISKLGVYVDSHKQVHIGFRGKKHHISSKEKIKFKKILPALEYGSKKRNIPARPLILPILKVTKKNINWLWRKFIKDLRSV